MSDKHSLAEEKTHSLSEEARPLGDGVATVGVYPHEDEARERFERREKKGIGVGGIIGWTFFGLILVAIIGVFVWSMSTAPSSESPSNMSSASVDSSKVPAALPQITETTNGKSGREMTVTREFTGTVVDYEGSSTPAVVFDIGGVQQQYQFRMGNEGKVAVGGTYKVTIQYWHNYWDFVAVEVK